MTTDTERYRITTTSDLEALLPDPLRGTIAPELLTEPPTAAALRMLLTMHDTRWTVFVRGARIHWTKLLDWARGADVSITVRLRAELAASLAGCPAAKPDLLAAAYQLDSGNFASLLDALRIAREGLRP